MSLTPVTPDLGDKKFWFKKDSIAAWVGLALVAVVAIFGWGVVSAFVVMMLTNTLYTIWLVAGIVLSLAILTSKRFRILLRLISRWLTNLFVPIFALEILEDRVSQARKRYEVIQALIAKIAGKIRLLKDTINKNHQQAEDYRRQVEAAKGSMERLDQSTKLRYALQMQVRGRKSDRLERANLSYQDILDRMQKIYNFLVKASDYLNAFIDDASDEVKQERIKSQTISDAYTAFKAALSIIKGDATEEELYGDAKQYLDDEYSRKSGEIEDGMRVAQMFIDNMDIENGYISDDALKQLDAYEQKLLPATTTQPIPMRMPDPNADTVPIARQPTKYNNLFK
jgi:hypothetical protein